MSRPIILQVGPCPDRDQGPIDADFEAGSLVEAGRPFEAGDRAGFPAEHGPQIRAMATRAEPGADAALIAACPRLEPICVHGVGHDAVGPKGMIIKTRRAPNIDAEAPIAALSRGRPGAAALDVVAGAPGLDPRFPELDHVLLQPHHASGTIETRQAMGQLLRDNLTAPVAGHALPTPVM